MGVSVGPKKFIDCFDRSRFAPLISTQKFLSESAQIQVCSHFKKNGGMFEEDDMSFSLEEFSSKLEELNQKRIAHNLKGMDVVIGGSNQAIENYLKMLPQTSLEKTCLLKISPKTGLEESGEQESLSNDSYLSNLALDFSAL